MSKAIHQLGVGVLLAGLVAMVGCEYEGSGDSGSWNSEASWVNFSGVYKAGNGALVSSFTAGSGTGTIGGTTNFVSVENERIETGDGVSTSYGGVLGRRPIVSGSVTISGGGFTLEDAGNGSLSGSGGIGSIDYGTGAWSIDLNDQIIASGQAILASYSYITSTSGGGGGGSGDKGSSGKTVFSFTVFQTGNKIEITDNNGAKYSGQLGNVASTSGGTTRDIVQPSIGDSIIAEYTAEGVSGAGVNVMMTGTFQGVVGRGTGTAMLLGDRRMLGTWVESKGVTGDINGQAAPIGFTISTTTTTP